MNRLLLLIACIYSASALVVSADGFSFSFDDSGEPLRAAESDVIKKYALKDPQNWPKAQSVANSLKATAAKKYREGNSKVNMQDHRSSLDGRYTNNSRHRAEGKRLLAESKQLGREGAEIDKAIAEIKKRYVSLPDADAVTGMREWTSLDGQRTITARVLALNGENLLLHREGGLILSVAKAFFSEADITYLDEQAFLKAHVLNLEGYEMDRLTEAYNGAEDSERDWGFENSGVTLKGRLVRDKENTMVIGTSDGLFYQVSYEQLAEATRQALIGQRMLASLIVPTSDMTPRLLKLSENNDSFKRHEWELPEYSLNLTGRLIDVAGTHAVIFDTSENYYQIPVSALEEEHAEELTRARILLTRRLLIDGDELDQFAKAYNGAKDFERDWGFEGSGVTLKGRLVDDEGSTMVIGTSDGLFYQVKLSDFIESSQQYVAQFREQKAALMEAELAELRKSAELGDSDAQFLLGRKYTMGEGTTRDAFEAFKWYRKAAEQGHLDAQAYLGLMYSAGQGVAEDDVEAVRLYRKAAEMGNIQAQFSLAAMYYMGEGVAKDDAESTKWYRKATEQGGDSDHQYHLGRRYYKGEGVNTDYVEAVKWYRKSAEQGHRNAQYHLAQMYASGEGVAEDDIEAAKWHHKAAKQGDMDAQRILGAMYYMGDGVTKDAIQAAKWYRKAAEQGDLQAQCLLGMLYAAGEGVDQDEVEAVKWFLKSAEQGNSDAQVRLANHLFKGKGVAKNNGDAVRWYRKAAEQGDIYAPLILGTMYCRGEGVAQDYVEAAKWYRKAAELGDLQAQFDLGLLHFNGHGVPKDDVSAYMWWDIAAAQGHENASHNKDIIITNMTREQIAEARDLAQGWLRQHPIEEVELMDSKVAEDRKAVEQGNMEHRKSADPGDAQFTLGFMYARGYGVPKDYVKAAKSYRKAAEQGHLAAQFNLGKMYAKGQGVPQDDLLAYIWWDIADAQGHEKAAKAIDILITNMTREQIAEARKLAKGWLRKHSIKEAAPMDDVEVTEDRKAAEQEDMETQFEFSF